MASIPGWAILFDPDECPEEWLPWTAQLVGVRVIEGESTAEFRSRIKDRPRWRRGTVAALTSEIQTTLTGAKTVYINERSGGAYRLSVATIDTETPDPDATLAAILRQKPAGIVLEYSTVPGASGMTWHELITRYETWQDAIDAFPTWQTVIDDDPI